jgi:hypothetical protein
MKLAALLSGLAIGLTVAAAPAQAVTHVTLPFDPNSAWFDLPVTRSTDVVERRVRYTFGDLERFRVRLACNADLAYGAATAEETIDLQDKAVSLLEWVFGDRARLIQAAFDMGQTPSIATADWLLNRANLDLRWTQTPDPLRWTAVVLDTDWLMNTVLRLDNPCAGGNVWLSASLTENPFVGGRLGGSGGSENRSNSNRSASGGGGAGSGSGGGGGGSGGGGSAGGGSSGSDGGSNGIAKRPEIEKPPTSNGGDDDHDEVLAPTPIPLPASLPLILGAIGGLAALGRLKGRRQAA